LDNDLIKKQFLRLAVIEQKKYEEIAKELGVERKQLSKWWDELKNERDEITEIRKLWARKKFTRLQFPDFYDWYIAQKQKCYYCGITEEEIRKLIDNKKIVTKRLLTRGKRLELERKEPNKPYDDLENLVLCCYWCNNAKTDEFTEGEFRKIGMEIGKALKGRLTNYSAVITDNETNFVYLSEQLERKYKLFFDHLILIFQTNQVDFGLLPSTRDVWVRDFMPIQISENKFVQFIYNPDYLRKYKKWSKIISDVSAICKKIGIETIELDIVIDGGNVVRERNKAILTNKIFKENPEYSEKDLLDKLSEVLEVDKIIIVPQEPKDWFGHADGMVRFYDEETVLINDYSHEENQDFYVNFQMALHNAGLKYIEIPYNPYDNEKDYDARGLYINYLKMKDFLLLPVFDLEEDEQALRLFKYLYTNTRIEPINSKDIAKDGGVLNCITWNIMKKSTNWT